MALIGSINIGLNANTGPFSKGMAGASRSLDTFKASAGRASGSLGFLGKLAGIAGIGLALKSAVGAAVKMETAMVGLAKATDLEGPGLAAMKTQLEGLSIEMRGVKLDDLIAIATTGAKMGIAAGDLREYAKGVAMVSVAMDDVPATEIADSLGKINTIFKLGVQGASQMGSAIDKLADSGVSAASDIFDVTQRISGTANALKLSAQETVALSAALLDTGTQAEAAAGGLTQLLFALAQTKNHAGFAKVIGVELADFSKMVKDKPVEAVQAFLGSLQKLNAGSQLKAMDAIGIDGVRAGGEILKLSQQTDSLSKYIGMANHEFATLDQLTKSYAAGAGTTESLWKQSGNQLQILSDTVGAALLPAINVGLGLMTDLATGMAEAFTRMSSVVSGWGINTKRIVETVGLVFRNLPDFVEIAGLLFTEHVLNMGAVLMTIPADLKIVGEFIANNFTTLIKAGLNATLNAMTAWAKNIGYLATVAWDAISGKGFTFDEKNLKPMLDGFKEIFDVLPELAKPAWVNMSKDIELVFDRIKAKQIAPEIAGAGKIKAGPAAAAPPGADLDANEKIKHGNAALEFGSAAAVSAIAKHNAGEGGDVQKKQLTELQKIVEGVNKFNASVAKTPQEAIIFPI